MFEPENDLEHSLVRAVSDPAHRPNFLLRMFNTQVFVALELEGPPPSVSADGRVTVSPGSKLKLRTMRDGHEEYVPIFTAQSRARATNDERSVFAGVPTRKLFERHPGRHFMLNPGHEHAQKFSSDDVKRMLAEQSGAPAAAASSPPSEPDSGAGPLPANAVVAQPVADLVEPKAPELPPPAVTHQPPAAFESAQAPRPPAHALLAVSRIFPSVDAFVFDPALARAPAPAAPVAADEPSVAPPNSAGQAKREPSPAEKLVARQPELPAEVAPSKPIASGPAAANPPASEKAASLKTAAVEVLTALKRLTAKTSAPSKLEQNSATPAIPVAPAGVPAAAKSIVSESPVAVQPPAPKSAVVAEPDAPKPAAVTQPAKAAANDVKAGSLPAPAKPVAPPEPAPATSRPRVAPPPPGSLIGAADPYPVEVLLALTLALQGTRAIETAHLAQVQSPGRQPHLLVALGTTENWEPLAQELRRKLQGLLSSGRPVEFTPLNGGMFEDHFRNETQPFFKRR